MFFTSLPREIIFQILREAVLSRGIQRAQHLRYVSRAWNEAVTRAIVESGVLETKRRRSQSNFWPRCAAYRALSDKFFREAKVPIRLYVVRLVAERVLDYSNSNARTPTDSSIVTLKDALETVCTMRHTSMGTVDAQGEDLWDIHIAVPQAMTRKMKAYYDEVLLGTAAWLNELGLLKETLESLEDLTGPRKHILQYAISAAAYKGHNEAVMLLVEAIKDPQVKSEAGQVLIQSASKGNQLSTVELGLELDYVEHNTHFLERALANTSALPIYERLYEVTRDVGLASLRSYPLFLVTRLLPDYMREMVDIGAVSIMDHLLRQADLKLVTWYKPTLGMEANPLYRAARSGRLEAVACLLPGSKRFPLSHDVLLAAAKSGNPGVVQLLLEQPATADWPLGEALKEAICREHEKVARMLLAAPGGCLFRDASTLLG
ncbi:hypothetical protein PG996_011745 [Apiospora saccharicola]|uniref:F-box domain-containing protein n=1 Tax=Apiospora saccharicola TaxID=335842 RepID=A0ABR1UFY4_9PEZI